MVLIPAGSFVMGAGAKYREETPEKNVEVDSFWLSQTEVTNAQFAEFVEATDYITLAEKGLDPKNFPDIPAELLKPGSAAFIEPPEGVPTSNLANWWKYIDGANWRNPNGSESSIEGMDHYPVVHIALEDALAYANWKGHRLPSEIEYEYASRGGLEEQTYAWGSELNPEGKYKANTWQGIFPFHDTAEDGFKGLAPVGCYEPNGYGLYDMIGNVWEWTDTRYFPSHSVPKNAPAEGFDPDQPGIPVSVIKGGSYLCSANYCARYRPAARQAQALDLGTNHIGFRTVQIQGR